MANVRINYTVDKKQVVSAEKELEKLNATTDKTQESADDLNKKFKNLDSDKVKSGVKGVNGELGKFNQLAANGAKLIGGLFAAQQLISFAKGVFTVTAEFQKFEAVLTNTLGSNSKAKKALDDITKFAAVTPFSVQQLTGAFVKLANMGFVPTTRELRKLGDLAASTGKDFDQLAEAVIDAQTGEFERLKEFGIRASKQGDQVTFAFKGVQTQTEFTSEAIRDYVLSLGDAVGVSGAMEAISQTVGGKLSNLEDNFDALQLSIGNSSSGLIAGVLDLANNSLGALNEELTRTNKISEVMKDRGIAEPGFFEKINIPILLYRLFNGELEETERIQNGIAKELDYSATSIDMFKKSIEGLSKGDSLKKLSEELDLERSTTNNQFYIKSLEDLKEEFKDEAKTIKQVSKEYEKLNAELDKFIASIDFSTDLYSDIDQSAKEYLATQKELNEVQKLILSEGESDLKTYYDTAEELKKEDVETTMTSEEKKQIIIAESLNLAANSANALADISANRADKEIAALQKQKAFELSISKGTDEEKARSAAIYDSKIEAIRRKQAARDKAAALFSIALDTAQGIVNAAAKVVTAPLIPFIIANGAIQAAVVASTPLGFNKGTKRVPGGDTSRDSVHAILTPGEGVMPVDRMNAYRPAFEAMFDRKINPDVLNSFVKNGGSQILVNNDMSQIAKAIKGRPEKKVVMDKTGFTGHIIMETQKIRTKANKYSW